MAQRPAEDQHNGEDQAAAHGDRPPGVSRGGIAAALVLKLGVGCGRFDHITRDLLHRIWPCMSVYPTEPAASPF